MPRLSSEEALKAIAKIIDEVNEEGDPEAVDDIYGIIQAAGFAIREDEYGK